jgi:hypothetical protein
VGEISNPHSHTPGFGCSSSLLMGWPNLVYAAKMS